MREMLQQTPLGVFVVMLAFPLAMTGVLVFAALRARRTAATVASATPEHIGMATDGYRRFEGKAEAIGGEALKAPLTGVDCVWYEATLERWVPSRRSQESHWTTVGSVTSSAPVLVRDATGTCLVDSWHGNVTPTDKSRWTGAGPEPVDRQPPRLGPTQSFSEGLQIAGGPNSKFRYTESRIYAGDALLVVGRFTSGRFTTTDDEDDEDDEDVDDGNTDDQVDEESDAGNAEDEGLRKWRRYDAEREATLWRLGLDTTRARVGPAGENEPLILASATAATHVAMNEMGAQAAVYVALVPLGLAALMLLARFG